MSSVRLLYGMASVIKGRAAFDFSDVCGSRRDEIPNNIGSLSVTLACNCQPIAAFGSSAPFCLVVIMKRLPSAHSGAGLGIMTWC